jgi:exodeoxyribonuclease-5
MNTFELTPLQRKAADDITSALLGGSPFRLGGYAGTGKTALASVLIPELRTLHKKDVKVVAPTGKAASVLRAKGINATTIHRLCYEIENEKPLTFKKVDKINADIVVCDEASMVALDIFQDLMSYSKPVLFIGDPGQLEPVGKDPKLMHKPDFVLDEVHRQALDNPIIEYATWLREHPMERPIFWKRRSEIDPQFLNFSSGAFGGDPLSYDQIICGINKTRISINIGVRKVMGHDGKVPQPGEKLICLANSRKYGLFNGEIITVGPGGYDTTTRELDIGREFYDADGDSSSVVEIDPDALLAEKYERPYGSSFDIIPFAYAYAITCHKSQGSEWDKVLVVDQAFPRECPNRWRYTAATRAAKQLTWSI